MSYRMESWSSSSGDWHAMDEGSAKSAWKPRATAIEAAEKCLTWTGLICIPAMRVIDLADGSVVWSDTSQYPDAGPMVTPVWDATARAGARRKLKQIDAKDEPDDTASLFDLVEEDAT